MSDKWCVQRVLAHFLSLSNCQLTGGQCCCTHSELFKDAFRVFEVKEKLEMWEHKAQTRAGLGCLEWSGERRGGVWGWAEGGRGAAACGLLPHMSSSVTAHAHVYVLWFWLDSVWASIVYLGQFEQDACWCVSAIMKAGAPQGGAGVTAQEENTAVQVFVAPVKPAPAPGWNVGRSRSCKPAGVTLLGSIQASAF